MKAVDKILAAAAAVSGFLVIIKWAFMAIIKHRFNLAAGNASAIGIIGSADGPTSIFVSGYTGGIFNVLLDFCPYITAVSTVILIIRAVLRKRAK